MACLRTNTRHLTPKQAAGPPASGSPCPACSATDALSGPTCSVSTLQVKQVSPTSLPYAACCCSTSAAREPLTRSKNHHYSPAFSSKVGMSKVFPNGVSGGETTTARPSRQGKSILIRQQAGLPAASRDLSKPLCRVSTPRDMTLQSPPDSLS